MDPFHRHELHCCLRSCSWVSLLRRVKAAAVSVFWTKLTVKPQDAGFCLGLCWAVRAVSAELLVQALPAACSMLAAALN